MTEHRYEFSLNKLRAVDPAEDRKRLNVKPGTEHCREIGREIGLRRKRLGDTAVGVTDDDAEECLKRTGRKDLRAAEWSALRDGIAAGMS